MKEVECAIARSKRHNEIVTLDYNDEAYETLLVECDDHTDTGNVVEFWADNHENTHGTLWRVHLKR